MTSAIIIDCDEESLPKTQTRMRRLRNQINPLFRRTFNRFQRPQINEPFTYMGHGKVPKNVTHVIVHDSVTAIPKYAFCECRYLKEVVIPDGLIKIGEYAFFTCRGLKEVVIPDGIKEIGESTFSRCTSLENINFPSTLRVIGQSAFMGCSSLARVDFNEGLHTIGGGAFAGCRSLLHLQIPPTVTTIGNSAFRGCWALKDVQLCEGLLMMEDSAFGLCYSLLRINIPSSVTTVGEEVCYDCNFLRNVTITPNSTLGHEELEDSYLVHNLDQVGCSLDLMKGRFDDLPLHRICFYRTTSQTLMEEIEKHATKEKLTQQDCLGMTPLHIIACSERHDLGVYKLFVDQCPEALLIKDRWGETPLVYAILSEAPRAIIHFLFEKYSNILNGSLPLDFLVLIEKLARKMGTNAEFVQSLIQSQRTHFPTLEIEWERIMNENVEGRMQIKMFRVLVEASVSKRSKCMSSDHQLAIDNLIDASERETSYSSFIIDRHHYRSRVDGQGIIDCIQDYEQQYREFLKEAMTLLELDLWKIAIDELENGQRSGIEGNHCRSGAEIVHSEPRRQCRFKCNTEDIFPIILSFL